MRSSGGTNRGLPCVVVALTNSTMACFAGPSFHEESGSAACALVAMKTTTQASATVTRFCVCLVFIALNFLIYRFPKFLKSDPYKIGPSIAMVLFQSRRVIG